MEEKTLTFFERVSAVQMELKAPKNQYNSFGKYNYRSCEDILEGAKPLCSKYRLLLNLTDRITCKEGRWYVEATATLYDIDSDKTLVSQAAAREDETKKGMDGSQITGCASSYARKYALNGLFNIDDTKDQDTNEAQLQQQAAAAQQAAARKAQQQAQRTQATKPVYYCADCKSPLYPVQKSDGTMWPVDDMARYSQGRFGRCLCAACMKKAKKAEDQQVQQYQQQAAAQQYQQPPQYDPRAVQEVVER